MHSVSCDWNRIQVKQTSGSQQVSDQVVENIRKQILKNPF